MRTGRQQGRPKRTTRKVKESQMKKTSLVAALLAGAFLAGCSDSDSGIPFGGDTGNTPSNPITAPTAGNIAFSVLGSSSTTATAANGILSVGNPNTATVVNVQSPTTRGGTITANADGSFTYNAPALGNTTDTFSYTIQNAGGTSTGTATVTLLGRGFFVNNQAGPGGTGTQAAPFQTLAQGVGAAAGVSGAEIVVARGSGAVYADTVTLSNNQVLRAADTAAAPLLGGTVTVGSNCTLNALNLQNSPTAAIIASGVTGGTFQNLTITSPGTDGIAMTNPNGSLTVRNVQIANVGAGAAGQCFPLITSTSVNVAIDNVTASNVIRSVFLGNITGNAVVTESVSNAVVTGGNPIGIDFGNFNNGNLTVSATNIRQDAGRGGCSVGAFDNTRTAALLNNLNITNCTAEGIFLVASNTSILKSRLQNSRLTGNGNGGYEISSSETSQACLRLTNNTSDRYRFFQFDNSTLTVENFASLTSENTGVSQVQVGTVTSVAVGNCQIP